MAEEGARRGADTPAEDFPVTDEMLDQAGEDSFPASDPPSYTSPGLGVPEADALDQSRPVPLDEDDRRPG
ncbi:MAG: hypothetical protein ACRDJG_08635 [Actinomycetota bacterium]